MNDEEFERRVAEIDAEDRRFMQRLMLFFIAGFAVGFILLRVM